MNEQTERERTGGFKSIIQSQKGGNPHVPKVCYAENEGIQIVSEASVALLYDDVEAKGTHAILRIIRNGTLVVSIRFDEAHLGKDFAIVCDACLNFKDKFERGTIHLYCEEET